MSTLLMFANLIAIGTLIYGIPWLALAIIGELLAGLMRRWDIAYQIQESISGRPDFNVRGAAIPPGAALAWLVAAWLTGGL